MEGSSPLSWQDYRNFKGPGETEAQARQRMTATVLTPEEVRVQEEADLRSLGVNYEIVREGEEDWSMIEALVHKSLPTHEIYSLERVVNPFLTYKFQKKKEELETGGQAQEVEQFGFRSSFSNDYKVTHRNVCSKGHVPGEGVYGSGIYFAGHAIYPTYLFRNFGQSPKNQIQTVTDPDADESGSMEMIVSELLLGNTFDYGNKINPSPEYDPHFQDHDSIQGTEESFGFSNAMNYSKFKYDIMGADTAVSMGWGTRYSDFGGTDASPAGPRFEASYYAKNPFDIENGRQYVFDNPDKCNPRFIVNIRPKVAETVVGEGLDFKNMVEPANIPQALMFQNKIIAEINGQRVVISGVNNIGYDWFSLGISNTIGLVDLGWVTPESTVGRGAELVEETEGATLARQSTAERVEQYYLGEITRLQAILTSKGKLPLHLPAVGSEVTSAERQGGGYRKRKKRKTKKRKTKKRKTKKRKTKKRKTKKK